MMRMSRPAISEASGATAGVENVMAVPFAVVVRSRHSRGLGNCPARLRGHNDKRVGKVSARNAPSASAYSPSGFDGSVSGVFEVVAAFGRFDRGYEVADVPPCILDGSLLGMAHPVLDLGEGLLDRVEIG